jgi:hypothetical protein
MIKARVVTPSVLALGFALSAGCSAAPDPIDRVGETSLALAGGADNPLPRHMPTTDRFVHELAGGGGGGGGASNLTNHGGPTITSAHIVAIYWGSSWSTTDPISTSLTSFIAAYGTSGEYNVITQYSGIQKSSLGSDNPAVWYDSSNPPTNVTDAATQGEVAKYLASHTFDPSAIYEVFTPNGVYSSDGSSTSCGGTNLKYCAYHGHFSATVGDVKYASMPYPSCNGCQSSGFSDTQNFEHFISHETREAVTDEDGNAWYDRRGYEADDKCAWSPTPFTDATVGTNADGTPFAYQYEWSNAVSGCVKTK